MALAGEALQRLVELGVGTPTELVGTFGRRYGCKEMLDDRCARVVSSALQFCCDSRADQRLFEVDDASPCIGKLAGRGLKIGRAGKPAVS
jgi:hypothetical protein